MHQQKANRTRRTVSVEPLEHRTLLAAVPVISGNGTTIANGDATPDQTDLTNFAWMYKGGTLTRQFVIQNTGDSDLIVSSVAINGPGAPAFSVVSGPTAPVAAGQSAAVSIAFKPSALIQYDAVVTLQTNDTQTPTRTFAISGSGISVVSSNGIRYGVISAGTGKRASDGWLVPVLYTGWLRSTGEVFDASSLHDNVPYTFTLGKGQVIKGWDKGILGMRAGERRVLFIPSALGYGTQGSGSDIPPNADLIFETEIPYTPLTVTGNDQLIAVGDKTPRVADNTAFYSSDGQDVTLGLVVDLQNQEILQQTAYPVLQGSGAAQFSVGSASRVGEYRYAIPVTYHPAPGQSSTAVFTIVSSPFYPVYKITLLGQQLPTGTTFANGALTVAGTDGNDTISFSQTSSKHILKVGAQSVRFNLGEITSVSLSAGAGNDKVTVGGSVLLGTSINGGDGRDTLAGGRGDDTILGGGGDDVIRGNLGNDTLDGADGNDMLIGGVGNDTLTGGLGQDVLIGGAGTNTFYAGGDALSDVLDARYGTANVGQWDDTLDVIRGVLLPIA